MGTGKGRALYAVSLFPAGECQRLAVRLSTHLTVPPSRYRATTLYRGDGRVGAGSSDSNQILCRA